MSDHRIELSASEPVMKRLQELRADLGLPDVGALLKQAIVLFDVLFTEVSTHGAQVKIVYPDGREERITKPFEKERAS